MKAALVATAQTLTRQPVCGVDCSPCCAFCDDMRPAPDKYQGWGGIALDHLFRAPANYYFFDQLTTLSFNGQTRSQDLTITDRTKAINVALVWTDRAGPGTNDALVNLVNDLDLSVSYTYFGVTHHYYGNNYYTAIDSCSRNGYSLRDPSPVVYDCKNNVERINIEGGSIPPGATTITVTVSAFSLTGDGINPGSNSVFQQDFALGVENAHQ